MATRGAKISSMVWSVTISSWWLVKDAEWIVTNGATGTDMPTSMYCVYVIIMHDTCKVNAVHTDTYMHFIYIYICIPGPGCMHTHIAFSDQRPVAISCILDITYMLDAEYMCYTPRAYHNVST